MAEECARSAISSLRRLFPALVVLSLLGAIVYRFLRGEGGDVEVRRSFPAMGTLASLIVVADGQRADSIADAVTEMVIRLDGDLDPDGTGSIGRLNTTGCCLPSPDLSHLVDVSRLLTAETGGCFDPTLRPLVVLWGFEDSPRVPGRAEVDSALALCGWEKFSEEGGRLVAQPGSSLDMGAIAAGYAADRACELAMGMGAGAVLVDMGGEIRCAGGRTWRIAVRNPRGEGFHSILEMDAGAVSTSGDYESFFEEDGVRYGHIIDPATGWPAAMPASVTVMHTGAAYADAFSTAFAVAAGRGSDIGQASVDGVLILREEPDGTIVEERIGCFE